MKKAILIILLFIFGQTVQAEEFDKLNLPTPAIKPGDFYYQFVRLTEKISEKFQFNDNAKFNYSMSLIDKRFSELGFVVKGKRIGEVQKSSERLAYEVGKLTDYLRKLKDKGRTEQLKNKINTFLPALEELRDNYPANSSYWMLIQHDINSLKEYFQKLSE